MTSGVVLRERREDIQVIDVVDVVNDTEYGDHVSTQPPILKGWQT